ncbi:MFS transporter [Stackebrandtia nassauensis]|uniref:Multidrug efflux pump Tap n=1 Tax=Stackebrandtia nassauensis (strain DSM 44728 / CIP 108903 / NRRL B-16338 / NBRC 102104 / LLR-40K-21) TaxID=446470 RepID=D3Q871_STANL|nr:MFS transporter [Stackebrandtia nassauensis]ADD42445.1 major facilitator superfamily MFS_1 [Stackebrandtia nassauensis DSM 44728]
MSVQIGQSADRRPLVGLLASTTLSITGNAIVAVAVPWVVYARTGSATVAGLAGAAAILPVALSSLFGGALIDRFGRTVCAVAADLCSAAAVAALPLLDSLVGLGTGLILTLVALGAVFDGPGTAARESLRPDVARVTGTELTKVNAWGEAAESVGNMVGPGLGGILIAALGGFGALWVTVALFLASALLTVLAVPRTISPPPRPQPYLRAVAEGLKFVVREPGLRAVALTATIIVAFIAPFESVVLNAHLQATGAASQYGLILTAFALGGLAGAVGYGFAAHRLTERGTLIASVSLVGLGIAGFALLPPVPVMLALGLAVGVAAGPINPIAAVIMQRRTPERLRGRVIGSYTSLALAAGPLGLLVMGPVVDTGGPATGFAVIGAGCLLAAVFAGTARGLRGGQTADEPDPTTKEGTT